MKRTNLPHTSWLLSLLFCSLIHAQSPAPKLIPFQGRLTDHLGNVVTNGTRLVMFQMFDSPVSGRVVWPGELHRTTVNGGLVNVQLGTGTPLDRVDFDQSIFLQITLDLNGDGQLTEADPPMLPGQAILPAVFAKEAADSRTLAGFDWRPIFGVNNPAGKIDGAKIGNITSNSITAGTINASLIAPLTITSNQIAQKNIGAAQIANGAIQNIHLAPGIVSITNLVQRKIVYTAPQTLVSIGDVGLSPILASWSTSSDVFADVTGLFINAQVPTRSRQETLEGQPLCITFVLWFMNYESMAWRSYGLFRLGVRNPSSSLEAGHPTRSPGCRPDLAKGLFHLDSRS